MKIESGRGRFSELTDRIFVRPVKVEFIRGRKTVALLEAYERQAQIMDLYTYKTSVSGLSRIVLFPGKGSA